jgi:hypothetical protein
MLKTDRQGQKIAPGVSLFWRRGLLLLACAAGFLLTVILPETAVGQAAASVVVQEPDLSTFPVVELEFNVVDANGQPLMGYDEDQVQVIENDQALSVDDLITEYRGVHFSLAINGNREMDLRDESGVSRYEKLTAALTDWAQGSSLQGDDAWSLETNEGTQVEWTSSPRVWLNGLDAYQPNFRLLEPELTSLQNAIQGMLNESPDFGVDQAILYISPPPEPDQIDALTGLTQQARDRGIRVDVWMVGESYYLTNDQGDALVALAANTGGEFLHYTGLEGIPNLDALHSALGSATSLTYTSGLNASGTYALGVSVALGDDLTAEGETQPFTLEILPPNPMLLSPPIQIERTWQGPEDEQTLMPQTEELSILVQFPDGRPRELASSRLLVDGVVMEINQEAPFDTFTWDLGEDATDVERFIQVQVEDQLGLTAETIAFPVQVTILIPEPEPAFNWERVGLLGAAFLVGFALVLLLVWLGQRFYRSRIEGKRLAEPEPVEEVVAPRPLDLSGQAVLAVLVPSQSLLGLADPDCILIRGSRFVLPDDLPPDSAYREAGRWEGGRLWINLQDKRFWLHSEGLETTVWLNSQPVGVDPEAVQPGDLIYFGNTGFRFTMNRDESSRQASVAQFNPNP